ncbi:4'-phosphopantetheinyl transferase [Streptomyces misionensis]|uniref:4'-phosphopantetheinyl transferase n=1 Tax=Streptomyces misionensis TaxID=67331 RepID=A0A1H4IB42_9ACTN|nr:4'-phosphopantetheinyl transferase superfamily protein [Streptomyces misionensis]SEB31150.1 4'-phosphopantetheinyl transferase [Streptomyces misionensis]
MNDVHDVNTALSDQRPVRLRGPAGPWQRIERSLHERGAALVYGVLEDWRPADLDDAGLRDLLGADWERYAGMAHEPVRARFAASRRLIKYVAGRAVGAPPHSVELAYRPGGRPYLRGCAQLDISLSHTGDLLLVGVSARGGIGVDVELTRRRMRLTGMESRFWTPHEIAQLGEVGEDRRPGEMVRLWTLKEAYSKAIGQGMRFRFSAFGFDVDAGRPRVLTPDGEPGTGPEWVFGTARVADAYTVSWAMHDTGPYVPGGRHRGDTAAAALLDVSLAGAMAGAPRAPLAA